MRKFWDRSKYSNIMAGWSLRMWFETCMSPVPTHKLTNQLDQSSSWEANSCSASQEIPCILWNLKFHYYAYESLPLAPILCYISTVHTFPSVSLRR